MAENSFLYFAPLSVKKYDCFPFGIIRSQRTIHAAFVFVSSIVSTALVRLEYLPVTVTTY